MPVDSRLNDRVTRATFALDKAHSELSRAEEAIAMGTKYSQDPA